MRSQILAVASVVTLAVLSSARADEKGTLVGNRAPEIVAEVEHWLGKFRPVTMAQLKGKVVWLHFNF